MDIATRTDRGIFGAGQIIPSIYDQFGSFTK
jgi:hypothetical protein